MTLVAVVLYRVPTAPEMILKWGGWRLWYLATPGANERLRPPSFRCTPYNVGFRQVLGFLLLNKDQQTVRSEENFGLVFLK